MNTGSGAREYNCAKIQNSWLTQKETNKQTKFLFMFRRKDTKAYSLGEN